MCGITAVLTLAGRSKPQVFNGLKTANGTASKIKAANGDTVDEAKAGHLQFRPEQLTKSLEFLTHRGPDYRGTWVSEDGLIGLGNARLEINDLTPSGHQPFFNPQRTIQAVVNGEIYNHEQLRAEMLAKMDYKFKGRSDCETVVALYQYYGLSFLSKLNGEYAICIHDTERKLFFAARDRSGVKPLYWTVIDRKLLVASEAKAFLPLGWKPEWDVRSLVDGGWNTDSRTIFRGVQKIPPGQYLTCVAYDHIDTKQYWDLDYPDKNVQETRTEEEMIQGVRARLLEAVRIRLQADVPAGIFLSGGIDSSVIAGMAKELLTTGKAKLGADGGGLDKLTCLGIAFAKGSGFDESEVAARTAEHLGVKYHKQLVTEEDLAACFEDATWISEQQYFDLGFVAKHVLSELAHKVGLKVILNGQGADEFLGGYPVYLSPFLSEPDLSWSETELSEEKRRVAYAEACSSPSASPPKPRMDDHSMLIQQALKHVPPPAYLSVYDKIAFASWTECYGSCNPYLTLAENISERTQAQMRTKWHPLNSALYSWYKTNLPNLLLTSIGDRTEMSHSIEGRTPFLDHNLVEYVNGIPPSLKIKYIADKDKLTEKWILREASKPFVTPELYERKKHPYSAPIIHPTGGPLHTLMHRLITKDNIENLGFLDWTQTESMLQDAFANQNSTLLGTILVIAQWVTLSQRFGIAKAQKPDLL